MSKLLRDSDGDPDSWSAGTRDLLDGGSSSFVGFQPRAVDDGRSAEEEEPKPKARRGFSGLRSAVCWVNRW